MSWSGRSVGSRQGRGGGGTHERAPVGVERLARDVEGLVLVKEAAVVAAGRGGGARRVGPARPLAFALGRRGREIDAAVIDLCNPRY